MLAAERRRRASEAESYLSVHLADGPVERRVDARQAAAWPSCPPALAGPLGWPVEVAWESGGVLLASWAGARSYQAGDSVAVGVAAAPTGAHRSNSSGSSWALPRQLTRPAAWAAAIAAIRAASTSGRMPCRQSGPIPYALLCSSVRALPQQQQIDWAAANRAAQPIGSALICRASSRRPARTRVQWFTW